ENWPFDAIAQTVGADEKERTALAALRESAKKAAERLAADCPQDVPAAPAARLEAVEQGIDAALAALDTVEPALPTLFRTRRRALPGRAGGRREAAASRRGGGPGRGGGGGPPPPARRPGGAARARRVSTPP